MTNKTISLIALLGAFAHAQAQPVAFSRIALPYMSQAEANATTPNLGPGYLFWLEETGPGKIFTTLGQGLGYYPINPDLPNWATAPAESPVILGGNYLQLDNRYRWQGNLTNSVWGSNDTPIIRISGNSALVRIDRLLYDSALNRVTLDIDAGAEGATPVVQYTMDLTDDPIVWTEVETYTLAPSITGPDGRTVATISPHQGDPLAFAGFYRVEMQNLAPPKIELLVKTDVTADLEIKDADNGLILTSPDGSRFKVKVGNDGGLFATEL